MAKKAKKKEFKAFTWENKASGLKNEVSKSKNVTKRLNSQMEVKPTQEFVSEAKKHRESLFKKK